MLTKQPWGDYGRSRGELALEPAPIHDGYGNWRESPWWSLHANALWCLTYGLDIWNLYAEFITNASFAPTMQLFNRYAGHKDPATAPGAVLMLRDGLDSADFKRFPAEQFGDDYRQGATQCAAAGGVCCRNASRGSKIAAAFAAYGARQDEPKAAVGKSVKQKKAGALNDVGCQIWPGNYGMFMKQQRPAQTSVGHWRVGPKDQPYGRFARGSSNRDNRSAMHFDLDDKLFGGLPFGGESVPVVVTVAYFGAAGASWCLKYDARDQKAKPLPAVHAGGEKQGKWHSFSATLTDAYFGNRGALGSDLSLHADQCSVADAGSDAVCPDVIFAQVEVRRAA